LPQILKPDMNQPWNETANINQGSKKLEFNFFYIIL